MVQLARAAGTSTSGSRIISVIFILILIEFYWDNFDIRRSLILFVFQIISSRFHLQYRSHLFLHKSGVVWFYTFRIFLFCIVVRSACIIIFIRSHKDSVPFLVQHIFSAGGSCPATARKIAPESRTYNWSSMKYFVAANQKGNGSRSTEVEKPQFFNTRVRDDVRATKKIEINQNLTSSAPFAFSKFSFELSIYSTFWIFLFRCV